MLKFKDILIEASVETFMNKIRECQTLAGLDELEKYYSKRIKELEIKDTDDISIRDALEGKRLELEDLETEKDE
ncbi:DNA helicase [Proteus phage phiP4-3]|uniref:UvsW.1 domain-containing protein n=1 Tax=Proteus phage phiP4-3 TaxID=2065203 RepID=A0A2I6PFE6_9CAUD|nr:DNA helicase [Proteus phage phiP4-3]AUM58433.1 hypothetical protein phiP43_075 [Proteus phage phiP4-3]AZV01322.1 hypothetical protein vBSdyM006_185 [Shigella phage vB_SdyM_006]QQV89536.1 hypothetical protein SJ_118 [Proteus phage SJ_PmiM]